MRLVARAGAAHDSHCIETRHSMRLRARSRRASMWRRRTARCACTAPCRAETPAAARRGPRPRPPS